MRYFWKVNELDDHCLATLTVSEESVLKEFLSSERQLANSVPLAFSIDKFNP